MITYTAGTNHIRPGIFPSPGKGNYMVNIKVFRPTFFSTVLTGIIVSLIDVFSSKFNPTGWKTIVKEKKDYPGNPYAVRDCSYHLIFPVGVFLREIFPFFKSKGVEGTSLLYHHLSVVQIEKAESPSHTTDIDHLPEAIENQNLGIK